MTQLEVALELGTTRANVSMIESRARRKVERAGKTMEAYRSTLTDHALKVRRGVRFYDVPSLVLREADRCGIHLKCNMVDIVRMVRGIRPSCLQQGKTTRTLLFVFDRSGRLRLGEQARA